MQRLESRQNSQSSQSRRGETENCKARAPNRPFPSLDLRKTSQGDYRRRRKQLRRWRGWPAVLRTI